MITNKLIKQKKIKVWSNTAPQNKMLPHDPHEESRARPFFLLLATQSNTKSCSTWQSGTSRSLYQQNKPPPQNTNKQVNKVCGHRACKCQHCTAWRQRAVDVVATNQGVTTTTDCSRAFSKWGSVNRSFWLIPHVAPWQPEIWHNSDRYLTFFLFFS